MNGPHDLGGLMGFGPIAPDPDEPLFHAEWERRTLGLVVASGCLGRWTIDESRFARENRHPLDYYGSSYYEIWIKGLEVLLLKHGLVSPQELVAGRPDDVLPAATGGPNVETVLRIVGRGSPYDRPLAALGRFAVGDSVRTNNLNPVGHTRLPRYVRGKVGMIVAGHGGFVFADENTHGRSSTAQHLYTVCFNSTELWGPDGDPNSTVSVDAWESYLEPA